MTIKTTLAQGIGLDNVRLGRNWRKISDQCRPWCRICDYDIRPAPWNYGFDSLSDRGHSETGEQRRSL